VPTTGYVLGVTVPESDIREPFTRAKSAINAIVVVIIIVVVVSLGAVLCVSGRPGGGAPPSVAHSHLMSKRVYPSPAVCFRLRVEGGGRYCSPGAEHGSADTAHQQWRLQPGRARHAGQLPRTCAVVRGFQTDVRGRAGRRVVCHLRGLTARNLLQVYRGKVWELKLWARPIPCGHE